jgi:hypothetical protein
MLFVQQLSAQLETLRQTAGPGIGRSVLEQAILVAERGRTGMKGLVEAVKNALTDRAAKGARQVEEHYCRESTSSRAQRVRTRIEEGIGGAAMDGLACRILRIDQTVSVQPKVHQGLDDGVRI